MSVLLMATLMAAVMVDSARVTMNRALREVYDHDRMTGRAEILFAKFTEADVLAGRLVNPDSRLQNVIFSSAR